MPAKIVVVDDEPDVEIIIRQTFRRHMREKRFDFIFAQNGQEALDKIGDDPDVDLVMTDINMPIMDGLTLLNKIIELNRPGLRTLIVSAYGDMDNIRTAMNRGAFDFLMKPIDLNDLELTITKTLDDVSQMKSAHQAREHLLQIQHELSIASDIQKLLLRDVAQEFRDRTEFEIIADMTAAKSVGGDLYDAFPLDDDHIGIVIGDVTGKGMPAALFMAVSITTFRTIAGSFTSTGACLGHINNLLVRDSSPDMFVTVFYGILNTRTGEFLYSNGGHNLPYLLRNDGSVHSIEQTGGILLGMFEDFTFEQQSIMLQPGDSVFMYTDGVTEAMNDRGDFYMEERLEMELADSATRSAGEILPRIRESIATFAAGAEQSDDITMLLVRYRGNHLP